MLKIKKMTIVIISCVCIMSMLSGCGFTGEQNEELGEDTANDISGIMLAGQEAPEIVGILKSIETEVEVIISVGDQDVTYRLSEDAKKQIEGKEVDLGREVTFTTYSIGDNKETIDKFILQ